MPTEVERQQAIHRATKGLEEIQKYDAAALAREAEFGTRMSFVDAVPHAQRLVELFRQVPSGAVQHLNHAKAQAILDTASSVVELFRNIWQFDVSRPDAIAHRKNLIQTVESRFDEVFEVLCPLISYACTRGLEVDTINKSAAAAFRTIAEQQKKIQTELDSQSKQVQQVLDDVRLAAAQEGVSQHAACFKAEAQAYERASFRWMIATISASIIVVAYATTALFLHKIPLLAPANTYETVQLTVGKILVFSTLLFVLVWITKNYMASKHNAIVNKHRQNALMTYEALVDAAGDGANRDIVLSKAAECIFGQQPTGYGKDATGDGTSMSMISLNPGSLKSMAGQ